MSRKTESEYENNRRRNKKITLRVTPEEYEMIKENAGKSNLPINTYILYMLKDGVIVIQNFDNLSALVNSINKIGVNINQIAHYVNENRYIDREDYRIIKNKMDEIHTLMINTVRINTGKGIERKKKVIRAKLKEGRK